MASYLSFLDTNKKYKAAPTVRDGVIAAYTADGQQLTDQEKDALVLEERKAEQK
jgi:hypothetical protein